MISLLLTADIGGIQNEMNPTQAVVFDGVGRLINQVWLPPLPLPSVITPNKQDTDHKSSIACSSQSCVTLLCKKPVTLVILASVYTNNQGVCGK